MRGWRLALARAADDAAWLAPACPPFAGVLARLDGRRVALVGNARSLAEGDEGARIDAADVVVRLNRAPMPAARSHGTRTDWLVTSVPVDCGRLREIGPDVVAWSSLGARRLGPALAGHPGFVPLPRDLLDAARAAVGPRPTTGLRAILTLAGSGAASVTLHGFDFFASLSLSGARTAAEVPHDFAAERAWVEALAARDPRVTLA